MRVACVIKCYAGNYPYAGISYATIRSASQLKI